LQGKLAGVQINQTTGRPGEGISVRVRGAGSISAGSEPLYVVDGFPIDGNLSNFNTSEIESITVLKDAASTSLYGSRAANGVVLITTKKGTQGVTEVGVNAYYGWQILPEKGRPDMMNGTEFAQFKKEYYEDQIAIGNPRITEVPLAFRNPEAFGQVTTGSISCSARHLFRNIRFL
jgi:TonB-dependent SusC/RagA subfamily outer membrane receptor